AGWLAGLPVSIKDLTDVAGVRTTYGSPLFANHVPTKSHPLVECIERKGGIVVAKSNTPEFGAGGSTFNEVFGRTRNPWNTSLTFAPPAMSFSAAVARPVAPRRVAFTADYNGKMPIDREIRDICSKMARRFAELGCIVEEASPDIGNIDEAFLNLRSQQFVVD